MARLSQLRGLRSLGFQSKLLIMLLAVSIISVLVAGVIGYINGTTSLRNAEYQRLIQLRESREREITAYYGGISNAATVLTHSAATIDAVKEFTAAFGELQKTPLPPRAKEAVDTYYAEVFDPALENGSGQKVDGGLFRPTSNAQTYIQSLYTVPAKGDSTAAAKILSAGDPSTWTKLNERFQPFFADFVGRFGFDDALLIDSNGNVVYSVAKEIDLGANVLGGPFKATKLAEAVRQAMRASSVDDLIFADFEDYAPSGGRPSPFVLTPIGDEAGVYGIMALQLSVDRLNDVMTGQEGWAKAGLGETGETYMAGPDRLMRSVSRKLLEDPEAYIKAVVANGTPEDIARRQVELDNSVLLQPVNTPAVNLALAGQSGVTTAKSYLGPESLVAYAPVQLPGLNWVMVAKIDKSEAYAPVRAFARNLALSTAAIVLIVSLLSLLFSRILTRPLKKLVGAVQRVSGGELGIAVPVTSRDEIGELASSFNDMSASLLTKQQLIDEQRGENDELLKSLMPEPVARRYREGEENISTENRDVSVVYAQMLGFDDYAGTLRAEESVSVLNSLIEAFDAAADRNGIERVRTMQDNGLLATCGLVVPRVDHASRTIAYAKELAEILERFNEQNGAELSLRVGIDSGPVTSGLVGERSTVYALWGEAVDLAHRVRDSARSAGIFVSDRVHDAVVGIYPFSDAGTITSSAGTERVWRLDVATRQPV
ncbi:adenylate/guanylate cyclase domain-containing protein [Mycolicibacterium sp.]|uniref:adenylate/guanylate cyclase domain-containing protein n=1 Tax=Mycolicibacterium sp. TaxID=2320850 RepID=UPI0028A9C8A1|nr:adenylate/guanylate cyclase domain-containing protein [Mycolicibacterium sp.]